MGDHLYLAHHGIKGMKWGVRRFRNEDGSLTEAGKKRHESGANKSDLPSLKDRAVSFYKDHEKAINKGADVCEYLLAVYGAYKLYENWALGVALDSRR